MQQILKLSGIMFIALFLSSCGYNSMVEKQEQVDKTWADVEAQYQRRADLVPNLVKTVKGSANFEQETLTAVIEARSDATSIKLSADDLTEENLAKFEAAQGKLTSSLSKLLVSVERYPDLKSTQAFQDLMIQLEGTENRITKARGDFNQAVGSYNAYIKKFPQVIYSGAMGFDKKAYFKAKEGTDTAPSVEF